VDVWVCLWAGKAEENGSILKFIYNNCWKGEEVEKKFEKDRDFIGKERVREENGNYGVRILAHDNLPDFCQVEIIEPNCIRTGRGEGRYAEEIEVINDSRGW